MLAAGVEAAGKFHTPPCGVEMGSVFYLGRHVSERSPG